MTTENGLPPKFSLRRWSQRKHDAARTVVESPPAPAREAVPLANNAAAAGLAPAREPEPGPVAMPSIESLSFESDFTAFFQPKVDEVLKRQALKKLFSDPRFNVMDGLDIYIDDYTKSDPIAPEIARELRQGRGIFGPREAPATVEESAADATPDATATQAPGQPTLQQATAAGASAPIDGIDAVPHPDEDKATAVPSIDAVPHPDEGKATAVPSIDRVPRLDETKVTPR